MDRAVALASNLLGEHKNDIEKIEIVPSTGGVFEVHLNSDLLFSKKELERFPEEDEVEGIIREKIKSLI
ncbi:Rdx family protein [Acetoanaerobium pronyense]|uniref:Rdx family protein n=1 Tax=Acetoanaerobium pronyense TaxID=1482736 RepID=UPI0038CC1410